ncbi:MAG: hypothetical protein COY40_06410 [Alphaproteobacteria bacterium CG_4_10_14_0_8_um_filter_53_9]|nr:MAG: hypothetical protein COY40_06410 [Alphaproteobacteria bacterium CG_4_10_14_0_8_um_filter_53_9]
MVTGINTSGITVGDNGKVNISGLSSTIDSKSIIDALMAAKRLPAVTLENKITANTDKITAYADFKTKVQDMRNALDLLRGNTAFGSTDVFKTKVASGTTEAVSGAPSTHVPSSIDTLLTASISSAAATGTHTINIQQLARAHQLRGDVQASTTGALSLSGTFDVNGQTITIDSSDSLLDVRSKINTVSATSGVTATVVTASDTEHYLVLTSNDTGVANSIDFAGGNALTDSLGLTDGTGLPGGPIKTELRQAANAILSVDGITGIERASNEINDILEGVTLVLTKAEANTDVTLNIETDLNAVKTTLVSFAQAYNDLRAFVTDQRTASDRNGDGDVGDNELGPLAYNTTVRNVMAKLGDMVVTTKDSNTDGFRSLSQIGITINENYDLEVNDTILDSKLLTGTDQIRQLFSYEATVSDARLTVLGRTADTQTGTYYLSIAGTDGAGDVLSANIQTTAATGTGGADDGSVTVAGQVLTAVSGNGTGLSFFFDGDVSLGPVNDMTVTVSRGLADSFYDFFNDTVKATTGTLDTLTTQLTTENEDYQTRIETIDTRLEVSRKVLENKYIAMEVALSQLEQLKSTISSYFDTANSSS